MEGLLSDPTGSLETCEVIGSESVAIVPGHDSVSLVDSALLVSLTTLWAEVRTIEVPSFQVSIQWASMIMLIHILSAMRRQDVLSIHELRCVFASWFGCCGCLVEERLYCLTGRFYWGCDQRAKRRVMGRHAVVRIRLLFTTEPLQLFPCCAVPHSVLRIMCHLMCVYSWSARWVLSAHVPCTCTWCTVCPLCDAG